RRLLALDVAAGTDEQFQLEGEGRSENTLAQGTLLARLGDGLAGRLDFFVIFMAAVDPAHPGPHDQSGEDHALDGQVRSPPQRLAVLEGARLALVGVADDVLVVALG